MFAFFVANFSLAGLVQTDRSPMTYSTEFGLSPFRAVRFASTRYIIKLFALIFRPCTTPRALRIGF